MRDNFPIVLPWALIHEGGYVNHPHDRGGATNKGIIQRTYDAFRDRMSIPRRSVRLITDEEVRQIYREQYWNVIRGDDLPAGLDYVVFDFAINSGPSRAAKFLQRIVGVKQDGWIGENTLAAVNRWSNRIDELIIALCEARMAFLKRLSNWGTFGRGWTRRVMGDKDGAQVTDHGAIDRGVMLARQEAHIPAPAVLDDHADKKAYAEDTSLMATAIDAVTDRGAVGAGAAITTGVSALSQLQGPLAWALAAVIVIGAVAGLVWLVRKERLS